MTGALPFHIWFPLSLGPPLIAYGLFAAVTRHAHLRIALAAFLLGVSAMLSGLPELGMLVGVPEIVADILFYATVVLIIYDTYLRRREAVPRRD